MDFEISTMQFIAIMLVTIIVGVLILYIGGKRIANKLDEMCLDMLKDFTKGKVLEIENTNGRKVKISINDGWTYEGRHFKKGEEHYEVLDVLEEIQNTTALSSCRFMPGIKFKNDTGRNWIVDFENGSIELRQGACFITSNDGENIYETPFYKSSNFKEVLFFDAIPELQKKVK